MKVKGQHYRTIWVKEGNTKVIQAIDQRKLPHEFVIEDLKSVNDVATAIKDMHVRGAGLIGASAGYGMYLAALEAPKDNFAGYVRAAAEKLKATRPTAINLATAVERQLAAIPSVGGNLQPISRRPSQRSSANLVPSTAGGHHGHPRRD